MYAEPAEFEYTNCCQPLHFGSVALPQVGVVKVFVLSCSENALAVPAPLSLVTPVTLSKDPTAWDIVPVTTWAEASLLPPPPTTRGPRAGR